LKILITGAAGFIGSQIAQAYLDLGHQVVAVDNFSHSQKDRLPSGARVVPLDICDPHAVETVLYRERPQIVNHHAALVSVRESARAAKRYLQVNFHGTINLLNAARNAGVKKFIFASSGGAIYGDGHTLPIPEEAPLRPKSPYGESKRLAERAFQHLDGQFQSVILRYGNVYGPQQDPKYHNGVITIFTHRLLQGKQAVIFGDGSQTRDYIHISDVVEANIAALQPEVSGVFNIGTGRATPLNMVYAQIVALLDLDTDPEYRPGLPYEVEHNALDTRRARTHLNWNAQISLEVGLQQTVERISAQAQYPKRVPASE
jgi:UDP-glucose 4-epimerase